MGDIFRRVDRLGVHGTLSQGARSVRRRMDPIVVSTFDSDTDLAIWMPVHDRVMGGESTGGMFRASPGVAAFSGEVSTANGGGFASVRAEIDGRAFPGATGLQVRVLGDGKTYRLSASPTERVTASSYTQAFTPPAGVWTQVRLPFTRFVFRVFGDERAAPPLRADMIRSLGFLIGDKQAGPFRLEIDTIVAYRPDAPRPA